MGATTLSDSIPKPCAPSSGRIRSPSAPSSGSAARSCSGGPVRDLLQRCATPSSCGQKRTELLNIPPAAVNTRHPDPVRRSRPRPAVVRRRAPVLPSRLVLAVPPVGKVEWFYLSFMGAVFVSGLWSTRRSSRKASPARTLHVSAFYITTGFHALHVTAAIPRSCSSSVVPSPPWANLGCKEMTRRSSYSNTGSLPSIAVWIVLFAVIYFVKESGFEYLHGTHELAAPKGGRRSRPQPPPPASSPFCPGASHGCLRRHGGHRAHGIQRPHRGGR